MIVVYTNDSHLAGYLLPVIQDHDCRELTCCTFTCYIVSQCLMHVVFVLFPTSQAPHQARQQYTTGVTIDDSATCCVSGRPYSASGLMVRVLTDLKVASLALSRVT